MKRTLILFLALAMLLGAVQPVLAEAADVPPCFIPGNMAQAFNTMLAPAFGMLGASDPGTPAAKYHLGAGQATGSVLIYSGDGGSVEINAFFSDGAADVNGAATTLGITVQDSVDPSDLRALSAAFALALSVTDDTIDDQAGLVQWVLNAIDANAAAMQNLNGYMLMYAHTGAGHVFTLIPSVGGHSAQTPAETPQSTAEPTPDPTAAPTPKPTAEPLPETLEGAVLDWNGVSIAPLEYSIFGFSSGDVDLRLYFRVLNNTDQTIKVQAEGITVNTMELGGGVLGTYRRYSDSGEKPDDFFLVTPDRNHLNASREAIASAKKVTLTLVIKDENYDKLYTKPVTLDLTQMKGDRQLPDNFLSTTVSPNFRTAADYKTLSKSKKKSDAVRALQKRLKELGYFSGKANGSFGDQTVLAVRSFCSQNNLAVSNKATPEMQVKLFSSSAKAFSEPWIPLEIGSRSEWKDKGPNMFTFRTQVVNYSKKRTIKGFELEYYITDVWGNRLLGSTITRKGSTTKKIKPGKTAYSLWAPLGFNALGVDEIHVAVTKIVFSDGEIREVTTPDFYSFSLH